MLHVDIFNMHVDLFDKKEYLAHKGQSPKHLAISILNITII